MRLASSGLFTRLENHVTVVTFTRLQAAVAYQEFARAQLASGGQAWLRPSILGLHAWLFRSWQEARYRSREIPLLLSPEQEYFLWQNIIEEDRESRHKLFDAAAAAGLCARTNNLIAEWQISADPANWPDRGDARQFRRWRMRFHERCREENWITAADLWRLLPHWIEQKLCAQEPLLFLLPHPLPPALRKLQHALGANAAFEPWQQPEPRIVPGRAFDTSEAELEFAARWARGQIETHPGRSISICIPNAQTRAAEIDRVFRDVFYSGFCRALIGGRLAERNPDLAYNLLSPPSLADQPIIAGALLLLEIARDRIRTSVAGAILRSPWIQGAAAERHQRARADSQLRRLRELEVSFSDLLDAASPCSPQLAKILSRVRRILARQKNSFPFSAWSQFIGDLLGAFGWPADENLSSAEQQAVEGWKDALSRLGSLSLVCENVPWETARDELRKLLDSPFEREDGLLAPVQILSPSQAAALRFDFSLVTGLAEDTWPPPRSANPFLPLSLQRQHELPGSSPNLLRRERDLLLAELFGSAPEAFATWSGRLSASVIGFVSQKTELAEFVWQNKTTWESYKPAILDEFEDSRGPAYIANGPARGGTGILKSQSLCPFRAFAEHRLWSQSPEEGCLGYDARDRGSHLHSVLEFVWKRLGNSRKLKAITLSELEALVDEGAREAVRRVQPSSFGKIVHVVELARLKEVVLDWLKLERERLIPFSVRTVEEDRTIELSGLKLRLRIDRIDYLENKGLLLIDYKSGEQKRSKLECPRPLEPQLLVYAAGIGPEVEGVLFAQLKQRDVRAHGWTKDKHFRNVKTVDTLGDKWDERMAQATCEVHRLAQQFQSGYAVVDPKKREVCKYCAQTAFCRINERDSVAEAEEE